MLTEKNRRQLCMKDMIITVKHAREEYLNSEK